MDLATEIKESYKRSLARLYRPPETPDEVRAKEVGVLQLFRDSQFWNGNESLDSFLRRRYPYARDPKFFSQADFEHKVPGRTLVRWAGWLKKNCKGRYLYERHGMSFELKSDALLYKLTFGGQV